MPSGHRKEDRPILDPVLAPNSFRSRRGSGGPDTAVEMRSNAARPSVQRQLATGSACRSAGELSRGPVHHTDGDDAVQAISRLHVVSCILDWKGELGPGGGHRHETGGAAVPAGERAGYPQAVLSGLHQPGPTREGEVPGRRGSGQPQAPRTLPRRTGLLGHGCRRDPVRRARTAPGRRAPDGRVHRDAACDPGRRAWRSARRGARRGGRMTPGGSSGPGLAHRARALLADQAL